jgi:glycerol-3-phosphate dehydrogenase
MADFDLAIIGGGINGVGIARDAAGRGLKVLLVEQGDLASGTSQASSKLIHGGLRYLEHGALRLVRAALSEREVLLRMAPHLIRPLRFVLPLDQRYRSPALLRLGLFIYDMIGRREILPPTRTVDLTVDATGLPLRRHFHRGYEYSDCFTDDARLVVLNAVDAAERGAAIRTRTRCVRGERGDVWRLILNARGVREVATARVLVKATSSCRGFTITTALIFCRRWMVVSCSRFRFNAISP